MKPSDIIISPIIQADNKIKNRPVLILKMSNKFTVMLVIQRLEVIILLFVMA